MWRARPSCGPPRRREEETRLHQSASNIKDPQSSANKQVSLQIPEEQNSGLNLTQRRTSTPQTTLTLFKNSTFPIFSTIFASCQFVVPDYLPCILRSSPTPTVCSPSHLHSRGTRRKMCTRGKSHGIKETTCRIPH